MSTSGSNKSDDLMDDLVFAKVQLNSMDLSCRLAHSQVHKINEPGEMVDAGELVIRASLYVSLDNIQSLITTTQSLLDSFIGVKKRPNNEKGGKPS